MLNKVGREANADGMRALFKAIDAEVEDETMDLFLSKVSGKSMEEVMAKGAELMASLAVSSGPAVSEAAAPTQAAESKNEEKEEDEDFDIFAAF